MKRDWSATRQAEENLAIKNTSMKDQEYYIDRLKGNIKQIDLALSELNEVNHSGDDLTTAIRSLGALRAMLSRDLFLQQHD